MRQPPMMHSTRCRQCDGSGWSSEVSPAWLKWARARSGLTFRELGKVVGLSFPYLHDIEHGRRRCPERVAEALAKLAKNGGGK